MSRRRDFLALSAVLTMCWVAASLPRLGRADSWAADWSAGWPVKFGEWCVTPNGVEYAYSFSPRAVALDAAAWLAALALVWVVSGLWAPRPERFSRRNPTKVT